jgi:outer membrane assembly lipoprotein YfiO
MKPQDDSLLFAQGCAQLESKDYRAAARTFKTLIKDSPTSPHREEAMWLRAAAFWGLEDYFKAFEQYEELLTTYAGSPHYRDALLKEIEVAEILFGPTRRKVLGIPLTSGDTEAVEILRKVYEHQPTGDLADDVVLRIADYYWSQKQWAEAEDYYDKYCREYPNGEAARKAELYRAKCAIERCRGARYDTTSLQLAYDRLRAFRQKFPAEAEKEDVGALLAQVRDMQAEALYQTVLHYVRSGRADAAAFYVDRLEERFPDSPWSEKAKKFLADLAMGHEPQKPEPKKQEPKP